MPQTDPRNTNCQQPERRLRAIRYLNEYGPTGLVELAEVLGVPRTSLSKLLMHYRDTFRQSGPGLRWRLLYQADDSTNKPAATAPVDPSRPYWEHL